jgi:phosphatidylinositol-3,4,5-trisphosphate 3-phosphatase/dual-specificity protein phosphatase PTEN
LRQAYTLSAVLNIPISLQLFDSAEEAIKFYNTKRCTDNQGLTLPSQIRYVRYFERILNNGGETPQPEARVLRGIRLHKCPYWIRPSITVFDHNGKDHWEVM